MPDPIKNANGGITVNGPNGPKTFYRAPSSAGIDPEALRRARNNAARMAYLKQTQPYLFSDNPWKLPPGSTQKPPPFMAMSVDKYNEYIKTHPIKQYSYWENPATITRYYNFIRSQSPSWMPPDWMDVGAITEAYNYLRYRNNYAPATEWKYLNSQDPGVQFLQEMATPPNPFLLESESRYLTDEQVEQQQPVNWNDLEKWQQVALGFMAPQTPNIEDRPEGNRFGASLSQSLLGGLGVGVGAGTITANPIVGVVAFLAATGLLTYQNYTGNKVPLLNEVMAPFNWLAEGAERVIGVGKQAGTDGFDDVLSNLPDAWKAAAATYETQKWDLTNSLFLGTNNLLSQMGLAEYDDPAKANEVWRIDQGITEPVQLTGARGSAALNAGREWISTGRALMEFNAEVANGYTGKYQEFILSRLTEEFGFSGTVNDLVLQTVIDPLNAVPFFVGKAGAKMATAFNNPRLAAAFKAGQGNLAIDMLPFGVQQIASAVTGVKGSMGLLDIKNIYKGYIRTGFYPASMLEMPDDMRTHFDKLVTEGVKPEDIKIEGNSLIYKSADGTVHKFTGEKPADFTIPKVEDLSALEKYIGGIDDQYGFKELRPTKGLSFIRKLNKLTPPAQVQVMLNVFHHNISALMDAADGDPVKMVDFFQKALGNQEVEPGSVGEAILKSPAMRAVNDALRYAIRNDDVSVNMLSNWLGTAERRQILDKIATALNETPAKILEQVRDNPDVLAKRLNEVAPELKTTPEALVETLKTFTGDDALPWNVEQFQADLINTFANKMDGYFKDKLGLAPDHAIFRLSNAMKGVQSLVLLGFNPAYFLNNWVNNVITRSAVGVGGYLSPKQINDYYVRMGIFPKDSGLSGFDEVTGKVIHEAQEANDLIAKGQKAVSTLNKIGIFTRLSGAIERSEGSQARVIGMKTFMDKTKKVGVGIRKMSPAIESVLDAKFPGMKQKIYAAINAGMNMREIENAIYGQFVRPEINNVVDAVETRFSQYAPGTMKEMLVKTGLIDRLHDRLKDVKNPDDVDRAFMDVENDFNDYIDQLHTSEIMHRAEEVKNIATAERIPAVLQLFGDMVIENGQLWINGRKAWESLYSRYFAGEFTDKQWSREVRLLDARQQAEMIRTNEYQLQTHKGIVDALGIENDMTRGFITRMGDLNNSWKDFWKKRTQLYKEYFQRLDTKEPASWDDLQDALSREYDLHTAKERTIQAELDNLFANAYADYTGWDATKAAKWRADLLDMRYKMVEAQKKMREKTKKMNLVERDAEYAKFNPLYNKMIADMKKLEHDGAYLLMNKPVPEAVINVPDIEKPAPGPNVELPDESGRVTSADASPLRTTASSVSVEDQMRALGFTDHQIEMLRPDQMLEAIKQNERFSKAKEVIKAKISAEEISAEADHVKRAAMIKQEGMLARKDVEDRINKAFPGQTEANTAAMALLDLHADLVAKRNGLIPGEATRDAWYATHIAEITEKGTLEGDLLSGNKGAINFLDDGRAVIRALESPDVSTLVHEIGHIFRKELSDADMDVVAQLGGLRDGLELRELEGKFRRGELPDTSKDHQRYVHAEEQFARGWERYLAEGDAPTPALRSIFRQFTDWMLSIYKKLIKVGGKVQGFEKTELNVSLNQKINGVSLRNVFDRLLVDDPQRPVTFNDLMVERAKTLKTEGRNYRFKDIQIDSMARKDVTRSVLEMFKSEDEARAFLQNMQDLVRLKDGSLIDEATIHDALNSISPLHFPENNPWAVIKQIEGVKTSARSISNPNKEYPFQFKVVDLDQLVVSNYWQGDQLLPNPNYPQELQPRNRAENQSFTQTDTIARELVPDELLFDGKAIDRGSPIVSDELNVLSGNGRMLALKRATGYYSDRWQAYGDALRLQAPEYGIDPATFADMKRPVLVRELMDDTDPVAFVNDANSRITLGMNATEVALNDAAKISDEMLMNLDSLDNETIEGALRAGRNNDFIKRFLQKLPDNERGEISSDGVINAQGIQRIINALFAKVYPGEAGERLTRTFTMSMDSNIKTAESAIMASLPQMARTEGMMRSGVRSADLSIANDIAAAVDKLASLRSEGKGIGEYLLSVNIFGENELTPNQKVLLKFIGEQRQPKRIRDFLREYANLVTKEPDPKQGVLFDQSMNHTKQELLDATIKAIEPEAEGLFSAIEPDPTNPAPREAVQTNELAEPVSGGNSLRGEQPESIPVESAATPGDIARAVRDTEVKEDYDAGLPVPIEKADTVDLLHSEALPIPVDVQALIDKAETYRFAKKEEARRYVRWVIDGERDNSGNWSESIVADYANSLDILRNYARDRANGVPVNPVADIQPDITIQKVFAFNHGDTPCVANVNKDGNLVAYLPEVPAKTMVVDENSRVLGLDPQDPNKWVYEDGQGTIKTVDETKPMVEPVKDPNFKTYSEGGKDYQVSEADFIEHSFQKKIDQAKRNLVYYEKLLADEIKNHPKRTAEKQKIEDWIRITKREIDKPTTTIRNDARRNYLHTQYIELVKEAISRGLDVPEDVIRQYTEFRTAQDARARYEKGRHTSFANKSIGVNDSMRAERGYKVKRQDGKPIEQAKIDEIEVGVSEIESVFGSMKDVFEQTDLTIAHTNGKHPFLSDAGGQYHPKDRTITMGVSTTQALAHEWAHWLDIEAGNRIGAKGTMRKNDHTGTSTTSLANVDDNIALIRKATISMTKEMQVKKLKNLTKAELEKLPIEERHVVEVMKVKLNTYWRDPAEVWARLAEQYISNKIGKFSVAADSPDFYAKLPGWWRQDVFETFVPMIEAEVNRRLSILRSGAEAEMRKINYVKDFYTKPDKITASIGFTSDKPRIYIDKTDDGSWIIADEVYDNEKRTFVYKPIETGFPSVDEAKAAAVVELNKRLDEKLLPQQNVLNQAAAQGDLFSGSAEDLPLFSGVPVRAQDQAFNPREASPQMSLFGDIVPEAKPTRIVEIAVKDNGSTHYIRIDLKKMSVIKQTLALHQGEQMTYRVLDASGKVIDSGSDANQIVNPSFGANALFQDFQGEPSAVEQFREYGDQPYDVQRMSDAPMGSVPLNGTPQTEPFARVMAEANSELIKPLLEGLRSEYKRQMSNRPILWGDVDADAQAQIKQYVDGNVRNDLASTKLAALTYGDQMRNDSLLDYSRRYGVDNVLGTIYPYQFWYTRTMVNWAKRMIDKPSWFAMYARLKKAQEKMDRDGMPTRLKGQVRIAMPWMPAWMGGGLWVDPVSKIFPFDQFGQPLEQFQSNQNQVNKRAEYIVEEMLDAGKITSVEAEDAKTTRVGSVWEQAQKQAEGELDTSANPASLVTMMMQPALWWQIPSNLASGTPEKISPLPITRTGQTIRELGRDTFLEPVTNLAGTILAGGEETIRKAAGLSEFGEWGDYYLDRTLAGMAADGEISTEAARVAMIQRKGPVFDEAYRRVQTERALRTPGAAGFMALKEGANPGEVLKATITGIFGGGLFSEGELQMRGLKPIYDNAWRKLDAGDTEALNKFYDDYPEYAARLALYDKPEERLHQFLVDSIWQRYMDLDKANRKVAASVLGDDFKNAFLNKETRSYDSLDDVILATWAQQLGAMLPEVAALQNLAPGEMPKYYPPETVKSINAYFEERDSKFPNYSGWSDAYYGLSTPLEKTLFLKHYPMMAKYWAWKNEYKLNHPELAKYFADQADLAEEEFGNSGSGGGGSTYYTKFSDATIVAIYDFKSERGSRFPNYKSLQDTYYSLPAGYQRKSFLSANPMLKEYWTWKNSYYDSHPDLLPYIEDNKNDETGTSADVAARLSSELTSPLISQLLAYATGEKLTAGAKLELDRIRKNIAPNMTLEEFLVLARDTIIP